MTAPANQNLFQPSKFQLSFDRIPYVTWFCSKVTLPGITSGHATQETPFIDAPIPGDKSVYDPLDITFLLDEPLYAWTTILDWIKGITFPESFDQYKNLNLQQRLQMQAKIAGNKPQYSDAMLTILSNKNNPILQVKFIDVFPLTLSGINCDVSLPATNVMMATATFRFTNYSYTRF